MSSSRALIPTRGSPEFAVVTTFTAFRIHAEECPRCEQVRLSIVRGWDWAARQPASSGGGMDPARPIPMAQVFSSWRELACSRGRELLRSWHEACQEATPLHRGKVA